MKLSDGSESGCLKGAPLPAGTAGVDAGGLIILAEVLPPRSFSSEFGVAISVVVRIAGGIIEP